MGSEEHQLHWQPVSVVLTRMCADGVKSPSQRYLCKNAVSGLIRTGHEEGLGASRKCLGPNVVRNVSQIAVYTSAKKKLLANRLMPFSEYVLLHIAASLVAGTVATTVCAPADVLQRGCDLLLMFLFMEQLQ
ncbi:uncharacterized protein RAG0_15912 [Rhynchosporium agropyri]|uniref:Uncharacterized protein n=1 Tax=Rhynchosporium agropyri TaxID=914238 RepID=A0A1E1LN26_9HELO|nr:uncharacterized protein RAG0_15912 [Rhynchosporium agropyri]